MGFEHGEVVQGPHVPKDGVKPQDGLSPTIGVDHRQDYAVSIIDVDGDGRNELLSPRYNGEHAQWELYRYNLEHGAFENAGTGLGSVPILPDGNKLSQQAKNEWRGENIWRLTGSPTPIDLDGDGDQDLLLPPVLGDTGYVTGYQWVEAKDGTLDFANKRAFWVPRGRHEGSLPWPAGS